MKDIVIGEIGQSRNSKVCLVKHKGELVARKQIKISPKFLKQIKKEANILKDLIDRHILHYHDILIDESENEIYIYIDYVVYKNLREIIEVKREKGEDFSFEVYVKLNIFITRK